MSNAIDATGVYARNCVSHRTAGQSRRPAPSAKILPLTSRYKSSERKFNAGCDVFRQGEAGGAIYSVIEGWVALYNVFEDGRRQILQFSLPGENLAFAPKPGVVMAYNAQALTDVTISVVSHDRLRQISVSLPEIGMHLAESLAQNCTLAYGRLSSIGRRSAVERVACLLLELFVRSRLRWPGHRSEEMHLPLTQESIGDATGLTGVHVNRVLRKMRDERILEFHYRRLHILNPDKLVDVARVDPHGVLSWTTQATAIAVD